MNLRFAAILVPLLAWAQTPLAAVEQALRSRVEEYFQDLRNEKFRQAMELVSEDTRTEYFKSAKPRIASFRIDAVRYSEGGAAATVTVTTLERSTDKPGTILTRWNIEHDKWVLLYPPVPQAW